ncbi:NAD(P)/FAD-dependent oxidoreductase [Psychrobacillus sp. NPDC096426]|uniref:NAD(P)/FAD-dependent oxidoreductase n=1 Tax=Psychrobacillus sp. NPDC096426 TaxID=3364491 RepID=UPI0037F6181F
MKKIVILGAGYGGLLAALTVRKYIDANEAEVTVVNQFPTHQIITELHRLAGGTASEKAVAFDLHKLFRNKDINLKIAKVESFSVDRKAVILDNGDSLTYDELVVALGSKTGYFGIPGLEENSFVLKSVDDANQLREHIVTKIKSYADTGNKADATIVIGGGGLTGVELVGEIIDNMPKIAKKYGVKAKELDIKLVEAGPSILPVLPQELIGRATKSLTDRGVHLLTGLPVTGIEGNVVSLKDGQKITANTVVWTGGVAQYPIVEESGLVCNRGKAVVNDFLQSDSHPNVFVVGDAAAAYAPGANKETDRPYAPTAQNAWQMGELVGYNLFAYLNGKDMNVFEPVNSGTLASLGRKDGVAIIGASNTQLKGLTASLMKEASNIRYLSHIKALYGLAY